MKVLITGSNGFIGTHLCNEFETNGYEVIRCDLAEGDGIVSMDIMKPDDVKAKLRMYEPDILINMAGQANVALSWKKPQLTVELNTVGLINILEAVKDIDLHSRIIAVGSSDEYGSLKENGKNVM